MLNNNERKKKILACACVCSCVWVRTKQPTEKGRGQKESHVEIILFNNSSSVQTKITYVPNTACTHINRGREKESKKGCTNTHIWTSVCVSECILTDWLTDWEPLGIKHHQQRDKQEWKRKNHEWHTKMIECLRLTAALVHILHYCIHALRRWWRWRRRRRSRRW